MDFLQGLDNELFKFVEFCFVFFFFLTIYSSAFWWRPLCLLSVFLLNDYGIGPFWLRSCRLQGRVSMETRQRQRALPQQKIYSVWTGGRSKVLQQAWCECSLFPKLYKICWFSYESRNFWIFGHPSHPSHFTILLFISCLICASLYSLFKFIKLRRKICKQYIHSHYCLYGQLVFSVAYT